MLKRLLIIGMAITLIMSTAFIPSPIALFIRYMETMQFNDIFGHVLWFIPLPRLLQFLTAWIDVYVSTVFLFFVMTLFEMR